MQEVLQVLVQTASYQQMSILSSVNINLLINMFTKHIQPENNLTHLVQMC